jgi:hypothetical protein
MAFATGKYALAICDRCGQQYKFIQLKKNGMVYLLVLSVTNLNILN